MAKRAVIALHAVQPALADAVEADLVGVGKPIANWTPPSTGDELDTMKSPLTIGQLKAISEPFYTRIHEFAPYWLDYQVWTNGTASPGTYLPWSKPKFDDDNHAVATVGQMKAVFSLRFESLTTAVDSDLDGLSDEEELLAGTDPDNVDSDFDGIPDWWAVKNGFEVWNLDLQGDPDHDGISNADEYELRLNPNSPDALATRQAIFGLFSAVPETYAGAVTFSNFRDAIVRKEDPSFSYTNWEWKPATGVTGESFDNLTPGSWDSSAWPDMSLLNSPGVAQRGIVSVNKGASQVYYVLDPGTEYTNYGVSRIYDFTADTVSDKLKHGILDMLPSTTGSFEVFSTYDHYTPSYVYNTNCWAYSLDLTGVAVASDQSPYPGTITPGTWYPQHSGTLLTRRHILFANHFPYLVGAKLRFVSKTGSIYERTVVALNSRTSEDETLLDDLAIAVLDSDLPSDIASYEIVGGWSRTREATTGSSEECWMGGVGFTVNQRKRASIMPIGEIGDIPSPVVSGTYNGVSFTDLNPKGLTLVGIPSGATLGSAYVPDYFGPCLPYHEDVTGGDSGSPFFVVVSGKPVVAWTWHGALDGTALEGTAGLLDAMIAAADSNAGVTTGYHVQVAAPP